jgi:hypothetical protein
VRKFFEVFAKQIKHTEANVTKQNAEHLL